MNRFFIDSNICIYAFDKTDTRKNLTAVNLLGQFPVISSQVIIETYNACYRKLKLPKEVCDEQVLFLCDIASVHETGRDIIKKAISLEQKYHFSFLDACIVSSAIHSGCSILYSEDMHHNLVVEGSLQIINPFV